MASEAVTEHDESPAPWWGEFELETGHSLHFRIGPLTMWVQRLEGEWRVVHWSEADPMAEHQELQRTAAVLEPPSNGQIVRFTTERPDHRVTLQPVLADRPVVTRPETPIFVLAGDSVGLYVGTPMWVRLLVGDGATLLTELPTLRPSDTWFGPSTREGELAYAARTNARRVMETMRPKPSRAVTRVVVHNHGPDNFRIERINLPVPRLSLYRSEAGLLWTSTVTLERTGAQGQVRLDTSGPPPASAGPVTRLSEPRTPLERNVLVRALSALLG